MKTNTPILKGVDPNLWSVVFNWGRYSVDPSYNKDVFEITKKKEFDAFDVTDNEFEKSEIIKKVIFNNNRTIVFWRDNTKTVVKCENEPFDKEKGLAMAISKKFFGNKGNYYKHFKKWIKGEK